MDDREEKIRVRAYQIWERQGCSGSPEDHWLEAELELKDGEGQQRAPWDSFEATVEQALPVEALDPDTDSSGKGGGPSRSSKA